MTKSLHASQYKLKEILRVIHSSMFLSRSLSMLEAPEVTLWNSSIWWVCELYTSCYRGETDQTSATLHLCMTPLPAAIHSHPNTISISNANSESILFIIYFQNIILYFKSTPGALLSNAICKIPLAIGIVGKRLNPPWWGSAEIFLTLRKFTQNQQQLL